MSRPPGDHGVYAAGREIFYDFFGVTQIALAARPELFLVRRCCTVGVSSYPHAQARASRPAVSITKAPPPSAPPALLRPTRTHQFVLLSLLLITMINCMAQPASVPPPPRSRAHWGSPARTRRRDGRVLLVLHLLHGAVELAVAALGAAAGPVAVRRRLVADDAGLRLVGFYDLYAARLLLGILQAGIFPCATLVIAIVVSDHPSRAGDSGDC